MDPVSYALIVLMVGAFVVTVVAVLVIVLFALVPSQDRRHVVRYLPDLVRAFLRRRQ